MRLGGDYSPDRKEDPGDRKLCSIRDQSGRVKGVLGSAKVIPQSDEETVHEKQHKKRSQKPPPL
jgi:hypothetical protein